MNYLELSDVQKEQVAAMFDQSLSDVPEAYEYEIGTSGSVLSRRRQNARQTTNTCPVCGAKNAVGRVHSCRTERVSLNS